MIFRRDNQKIYHKVNKMSVKGKSLEDVSKQQLVWHGHLMRMDEDRLLNVAHNWIPARKQKKIKTMNHGREVFWKQ